MTEREDLRLVRRAMAWLAVLAVAVFARGAARDAGAAAQGLRVVDRVAVGDRASEVEHEAAAGDAPEGVERGRTFRQVRGSLGYSLRIYEDSEVVLESAFLGSAGTEPAFELLVEGRQVTTCPATRITPWVVTVRHRVPFEWTRGLTAIRVIIRAAGGTSLRLTEIRTVQEHLEVPAGIHSSGARAGEGPARSGLGPVLPRVVAATPIRTGWGPGLSPPTGSGPPSSSSRPAPVAVRPRQSHHKEALGALPLAPLPGGFESGSSHPSAAF